MPVSNVVLRTRQNLVAQIPYCLSSYKGAGVGNAIRFSGAIATKAVRDSFIRGPKLKEALKGDDSPYVGELPERLRNVLEGISPEAFLEILDHLSQTINEMYPNNSIFIVQEKKQKLVLAAFDLKVGKDRLKCEPLGVGGWGVVYKLTLKNQEFAFKVFYNPKDEGLSLGAYADVAAGIYFTQNQITKNMVETYLANPSKGWTLLECVDKTTKLEDRSGKTYEEAGFSFPIDADPANYINSVRIDTGGAYKDLSELHRCRERYRFPKHEVSSLKDLRELLQKEQSVQAALQNPSRRMLIFAKLPVIGRHFQLPSEADLAGLRQSIETAFWNLKRCFPDQRERLQAYKLGLARGVFFKKKLTLAFSQGFDNPLYQKAAAEAFIAYPEGRRIMMTQKHTGLNPRDEQEIINKIKLYEDCLGVRIAKGEVALMSKFLKLRCPKLKVLHCQLTVVNVR